MRRTVALSLLPAAALFLVTTAACKSTSDAAADSGSTKAAAKPAAAATTKKPTVDACTLLTEDEVKAVIGANDGGTHGGGVGESVCAWENQNNYYSITLAIGSAGTAPGGKLSADDTANGTPGPDGVSFSEDNTATYADHDRSCYIQVVTLSTTKDRATAVRLMNVVKGRTAGKF